MAFLAFLWGLRFAITSRTFWALRNKSPQKSLCVSASLFGRYAMALRNGNYATSMNKKRAFSFYHGEIEWQQRGHMREIGENHGLS